MDETSGGLGRLGFFLPVRTRPLLLIDLEPSSFLFRTLIVFAFVLPILWLARPLSWRCVHSSKPKKHFITGVAFLRRLSFLALRMQGDSEPPELKSEEKAPTQGSPASKTHTFSVDAPPFDPSKVGMGFNKHFQGPIMPDGGDAGMNTSGAASWEYQQYMLMMSGMGGMPMYPPPPPPPPPPMAPYQTPAVAGPPPPTTRREPGEKEGLSVHAKPWSPFPETAPETPVDDSVVDIAPAKLVARETQGKEVFAPALMISKEASNNLFVHSFTIVPKKKKDIELEFYNYLCARCPLKTLYGKLSSRKADVTLRNVAGDVPPLCVAHLIEQITKAKVTSLCVNDDFTQYEVWLDKPNMSSQVVNSLSGNLWTCPLFHGYAVFPKGDASKNYLKEYLDQFKSSPHYSKSAYPLAFVEAKEH